MKDDRSLLPCMKCGVSIGWADHGICRHCRRVLDSRRAGQGVTLRLGAQPAESLADACRRLSPKLADEIEAEQRKHDAQPAQRDHITRAEFESMVASALGLSPAGAEPAPKRVFVLWQLETDDFAPSILRVRVEKADAERDRKMLDDAGAPGERGITEVDLC